MSLFSGEIVPGLSPAINEVTPGWVLSDAQYSVLRNSDKFAKRNRSKHTEIPSEVIRKEIVEMILDAREILRNVDPSSAKHQDAVGAPIYTDKECSGIGKNYMKESSRVKAIDTYTFFAKHYALMGMYRQLQSGVLLANIFDPASALAGTEWAHQQQVLLSEFDDSDLKVVDLLHALAESQKEIARSAENSKVRDDKRGIKTIPDYDLVHRPPAEEAVVVAANKLSDEIASFATTFKSKL